jgi:hypothetical protein
MKTPGFTSEAALYQSPSFFPDWMRPVTADKVVPQAMMLYTAREAAAFSRLTRGWARVGNCGWEMYPCFTANDGSVYYCCCDWVC